MLQTLFKTFVDKGNEYVWETPAIFPWLVALLLLAGIYITFRMGWVNVRYLGHALGAIRGRYDNPADEGDINHFQALTTALSATVGIGNIAGVATAIHYGGPGVIFWMWISGIFGMSLKFAECSLSMNYRTFDAAGNASGGPMYYIERGLGRHWKWMAVVFAFLAIVCSFGSGNMNQANTVAISADADFDLSCYVVGIVLALIVGIVIIGGIKRIGAVSSRLMPFMAVVYVAGALCVLFAKIESLPGILATICSEAFTPSAGFGGAAAGVWNLTLLWGIKRALFSNEAGQGSAPIAHAAAKTKEPIREGLVAMLGPLVDTLTICTITGLVILSTGVWDKKKDDRLVLNLNKIELYALPADGRPLSDRDLHDPEREPELFQGTTAVEKGVAAGVAFAVNDALIDGARLTSSGAPYTGPLTVDGTAVNGAEGRSLDLDVEGRAIQNSSALTAFAFRKGFDEAFGLGGLGNLIVTISVFLFAISTMISWSYYGDRCVEYLFGVRYVMVYRAVYVGFTFLGAVLALETVWAYGDLALGLMSVPNLIAVLLLSPVLARLAKDYFSREHARYK